MAYDLRRRRLRAGGPLPPPALPRQVGPPAPIPAVVPGSVAPEHGILIAQPPVNFPPKGAIPLDEMDDADIAAGATATVITIDVPGTMQLRIDGIGFSADDETALRFLTWRMRTNGNPVAGYYNVPASIGSIREVSDVFVHVSGPQQLELLVSADAAAIITYRYIARVKGWFFGEEVRQ
jgi:hypothetical protein